MPGAEDRAPALCSLPEGAWGQNGDPLPPQRISSSTPRALCLPGRAARSRAGMGCSPAPGCPAPGGPPLPEVAFSPPPSPGCRRAVRGRGEPDAPGAASAGSGRGPSGVAASPKPAAGEKYGKGAQRWCGRLRG